MKTKQMFRTQNVLSEKTTYKLRFKISLERENKIGYLPLAVHSTIN